MAQVVSAEFHHSRRILRLDLLALRGKMWNGTVTTLQDSGKGQSTPQPELNYNFLKPILASSS